MSKGIVEAKAKVKYIVNSMEIYSFGFVGCKIIYYIAIIQDKRLAFKIKSF